QYQLLGAGELFTAGQPGEDSKSGNQVRFAVPQHVLDPAQDALLASGQAHMASPPVRVMVATQPAEDMRDRGVPVPRGPLSVSPRPRKGSEAAWTPACLRGWAPSW